MQTYYNDLAPNYDEFHSPRIQASVDALTPHLELRPDDILADIGGGTGLFSHLVWKQGILKSPVLCVDPSPEMLAVASRREGVQPLLTSAEEFVCQEYMTKYNVTKLIFLFSVHYTADVTRLLEKAAKCLPVGGKCIVCIRVIPTLPYFSAAQNEFKSEHYSKKKAEVLSFVSNTPHVEVSIHEQPLTYKMPKSLWYTVLRNRFEAHLEVFSDERIEDGIRELEETTFKGVGAEEQIVITDVSTLSVISKVA